MKNVTLFLFIVCYLNKVQVLAQDESNNQVTTETFYYSSNWELTTPEGAAYTRVAQFDLHDMVFDGVYKDYDQNQHIIRDGYYDHGKLIGFQSEYYENGATKSSIEYTENDFTIWQLAKEDKTLSVARGSGVFEIDYFYFFDWKLKPGTMKGELQHGTRVGTWIYTDENGRVTDKETYTKGKLVSHLYFHEDDSISIPRKKEVVLSSDLFLAELMILDKGSFNNLNEYMEAQVHYAPSFQRQFTASGGLKKLLLLLAQQAQVPDKMLVLVRLKLDEHASVLSSSVVRSVDEETDNRVLKAIEIYDAYFIPPIKNGKPYSTVIYLPVAGGKEWTELISQNPSSWFLDVNNFY